MGRRSHKPDPTSRRQVEAMAGYGVPEVDIACVLDLDPKTLRKHYRSELDKGHIKATTRVAETRLGRHVDQGLLVVALGAAESRGVARVSWSR